MGALFHDYGKAKIRPDIADNPEHGLYKKMMKEHPKTAIGLLEKTKVIPPQVLTIIEQHHEYHDGSGYPEGLKEDEIYNLSKIVIIANEVENFLSEMTEDDDQMYAKALSFLYDNKDIKFDPEVAETCHKALTEAFAES